MSEPTEPAGTEAPRPAQWIPLGRILLTSLRVSPAPTTAFSAAAPSRRETP